MLADGSRSYIRPAWIHGLSSFWKCWPGCSVRRNVSAYAHRKIRSGSDDGISNRHGVASWSIAGLPWRKPCRTGHKAGAGTLVARERAAQIMGLLETAKMNGLGASLLTDELKRLPGWPEESQDELLPFPPYGVSE